jgi:uncharacterized membrane protein/predicted DsbA family dithiol-disulfide isomerase
MPETQSLLPPPIVRWVLCGLAAMGLAVAGFLLFTHIAAELAVAGSTVPLCSGLSWIDCQSVLNSRWATVAGVPVALPAAAMYALLLGVLIAMRPGRSEAMLVRLWWVVNAGAAAAAVSAVWFIYLQVSVIGQLCSWCMIEHLVGLTLSVLVGLRAVSGGKRGAVFSAAGIGAALAGLLVLGQMFVVPRYTQEIAWQADAEQWVEAGEAADLVALSGGHVLLNRQARPVLGLSGANRYIVEVLDYTCGRCGMLHRLLKDARPLLPRDVAVLIVWAPQSGDCNPEILETHPRYIHSCALAKLAAAVWLAEPSRFPGFHDWLFNQGHDITPTAAEAEAVRRVGRRALDEALADDRLAKMIQRDLQLAARLGVGRLPGLIVADRRFAALPEEATELARIIRRALAAAEPAE